MTYYFDLQIYDKLYLFSYTEALFFSLLAFSFITVYLKKYWITSVLLIPLVLVRPNGIVCILPLYLFFIEQNEGIINYFKNNKSNYLKDLLIFVSAPLSLLLYCFYQKSMTGFYLAFIKAQAGWYKQFMFPLLSLFRRSDFTTQFNSVYIIVVMILLIIYRKKFTLSMNLLIWINILLPMTSGSVACMPRYVSIIFPISIILGTYFIKINHYYLLLLGVFCLQLITFYPWLISHPFSY